ncbi:MAG: MoaD/ThiS family protein [Nitrospinota bacterium]
MAVKFLFFGQTSKWMSRSSLELKIKSGTTLFECLKENSELAPILSHRQGLQVSVNSEFADFLTKIHDGDEVAFLPPFSGG